MKHTVTLTYERTMTFEVLAESPYDAYCEALQGFECDDLRPTEDDASELELAKLTFGDREIEFDSNLDFSKKDQRGLSCWKWSAYEDDESFHRHRLGADHDLEALIERVAAMPKPQQETP